MSGDLLMLPLVEVRRSWFGRLLFWKPRRFEGVVPYRYMHYGLNRLLASFEGVLVSFRIEGQEQLISNGVPFGEAAGESIPLGDKKVEAATHIEASFLVKDDADLQLCVSVWLRCPETGGNGGGP